MILPQLLLLLLAGEVPAKDLAVARRVAAAFALPDPTRAAFLEALKPDDTEEDREIGFGCRRMRVALFGDRSGVWLTFLVWKGRIGPVEARCDAGTEEDWEEMRKDLSAIYPAKETVATKTGLVMRAGHRAGPDAFRDTRSEVLGPPLAVDPHPDLEAAYQMLWSPLTEVVYGLMQGDGGGPPGGREAIEKILAHEHGLPLLLDLVRCPNPEGRLYAAEALLRLEKKGTKLSEQSVRAIDWIRKSDVKINVTRGCLLSDEPAAEPLKEMLADLSPK